MIPILQTKSPKDRGDTKHHGHSCHQAKPEQETRSSHALEAPAHGPGCLHSSERPVHQGILI
jgi:hypothetical protein